MTRETNQDGDNANVGAARCQPVRRLDPTPPWEPYGQPNQTGVCAPLSLFVSGTKN